MLTRNQTALTKDPVYQPLGKIHKQRYGFSRKDNCILLLDKTNPRMSVSSQTLTSLMRNNINGVPQLIMEQTTGGSQPTVNARNWEFDGAADFYEQEEIDDETGWNQGPTTHGLNLADLSAFLFCDGLDLTPYITISGNRIYTLILYDAGGDIVYGYIGENDNAEVLGSDLATNGGFETAGGGGADIWANWTEAAGDGALSNETSIVNTGSDAAKITTGGTNNTSIYSANIAVTAGALYRIDFYTRVATGDNASQFKVYDVTGTADILAKGTTGINATSYTLVTRYITAPASCENIRVYFYASDTNTDIAYFDDLVVKEVTSRAATGVKIYDAVSGGAQSWLPATIPAGFDFNDSSYTMEVRRAEFNILDDLTVQMWVKPDDGQPGTADTLVSKTEAVNNLKAWWLSLETDGTLLISATESGGSLGTAATDSAVFTNGAQSSFKQVGFGYTSENFDIYVNGAEVASTQTIPQRYTTLFDTPVPFVLGAKELISAPAAFFDGQIAQAMVFSRALSAMRIQIAHNKQKKSTGL